MSDEKNLEVQDTPENEKTPAGAELFEWLQMIMSCVLGAVIAFNLFLRLSVVEGHSMDPTLQDGELMLVWSLGYSPKQGDIVILNKTTAAFLDEAAIVKRVIALEGQTVDIDYSTGTIYVDGQPLKEDYTLEPMYLPFTGHMQQTHFEVPEGEIFVLGDNRNNSTDSRDDRLGTIDKGYLLGRAVAAVWPVNKIGLI